MARASGSTTHQSFRVDSDTPPVAHAFPGGTSLRLTCATIITAAGHSESMWLDEEELTMTD